MASVEFSGGDKLEAALKQIAERLGKASEVKAGFMSGATYPDGTKVAMVAAIQNYGAPAKGIPPRPFFSGMVDKESPTWGDRLAKIIKGANYDGQLSLERMGYSIASDLQQSILATNSPALAPSTIAAKGFSKPLVDSGHMLNSVEYDVDGTIHEMPEINAR